MWLKMTAVRLWHSALLFILASTLPLTTLTQTSALMVQPPSNYKVVWDNNTNKLQCMNENEINDKEDPMMFQWKFDGLELENELTSSDSIQLEELEDLDLKNLEKVECLASNSFGTSYAFLQFENGSIID